MIDKIENIRNNFPILENKIQLSSCSQSAQHIKVKNSVSEYMASWEKNGTDWEYWMEICENARMKFAKLINAETHEIAIVSSTSHAISSILTSLQSGKDEILLSESEFPSIGHASLSQAGKIIKYASSNLKDYSAQITKNTLLTSAPYVSFYNGEIMDIKGLTDLAHTNESYMFVDAYQAAGQIDIDVKALDVDFLSAGMQKYMLGIPGIAFLYIKEEIADELTPHVTGWFGQKNPFAFDIKNIEYAKSAVRFDTGTPPMINGFAADSALDVILGQGTKNIEEYLKDLSKFTLDYVASKNLEIASPTDVQFKGSNTAIRVKNANEMESELSKRGIIASARNDVIRIAPHFYNTKEDIEIAVDNIIQIKDNL